MPNLHIDVQVVNWLMKKLRNYGFTILEPHDAKKIWKVHLYYFTSMECLSSNYHAYLIGSIHFHLQSQDSL